MGLPPKLEVELGGLRAIYAIEVVEDPSFINLIFKAFPLGEGYSAPAADLLIRVPRSYPDSGLDMFWISPPTITLVGGGDPQSAGAIEQYLGRPWRRFSWHWQRPWNPNVDNLSAYIEFVRRRLRERR